jgi:hypothetical protein
MVAEALSIEKGGDYCRLRNRNYYYLGIENCLTSPEGERVIRDWLTGEGFNDITLVSYIENEWIMLIHKVDGSGFPLDSIDEIIGDSIQDCFLRAIIKYLEAKHD